MIETILATKLPVDEQIEIRKNRLQPAESMGTLKRLCVVTGIHGDELEGQYICFELIRRIQQDLNSLKGIVDIYPAINPLGVDSITRGVPRHDLDMNNIFPGSENGTLPERIALKVMEDIKGADLCIDLHASNIFIRELPQVRLSEVNAAGLMPFAKLLNVDFIWVHPSATVLEATLAHSLNAAGVPTLAVEMGVGMRITRPFGDRVVLGLFQLMHELGIWEKKPEKVSTPTLSTEGKVRFVSAETAGIFLPRADGWEKVQKGECLGHILNPLTGEIGQELLAPCGGMVFSLREYPVVYPGSLIARIWEGRT